MNYQQALDSLVAALTSDPEVAGLADWHKIVMVGIVQDSSANLFGYCFDARGEWEAAAPRQAKALTLLRNLRESMPRQPHPWASCMLVIWSHGDSSVIPEYADATRWSVNPKNLMERIDEFRSIAMPRDASLRPSEQ